MKCSHCIGTGDSYATGLCWQMYVAELMSCSDERLAELEAERKSRVEVVAQGRQRRLWGSGRPSRKPQDHPRPEGFLVGALCSGSGIDPTELKDSLPKLARLCQACPVRESCFDYGAGDEWSIYGGATPRMRRKIRLSRHPEAAKARHFANLDERYGSLVS